MRSILVIVSSIIAIVSRRFFRRLGLLSLLVHLILLGLASRRAAASQPTLGERMALLNVGPVTDRLGLRGPADEIRASAAGKDAARQLITVVSALI
jgi:hypothetical protein